MTFTDLPANWPTLPLTDPALAADVVDLFVSQGDRRRGVLSALLCDAEARFLAAIHLDLPENTPFISPKACAKALAPLIPALQIRPDGALLLALGRPAPDPGLGPRLESNGNPDLPSRIGSPLGFYIATPGDLYAAPLPVAVSIGGDPG